MKFCENLEKIECEAVRRDVNLVDLKNAENDYSVARIGFDTPEKELSKVRDLPT